MTRNNQKTAETDLIVRALGACQIAFLIADVRAKDMPIIMANEALEKLTGYQQAEILGRNCRFLQSDDRDQPGRQVIRNALHRGSPCRTVLRNYKRDGTKFLNQLRLSPIRAETGAVTHYVGFQTELDLPNLLSLRSEALLRVSDLTPREREMLSELAVGQTTKSAAHNLGISPRTAEKHRQSLCRKLGLTSARQLMRWATEPH